VLDTRSVENFHISIGLKSLGGSGGAQLVNIAIVKDNAVLSYILAMAMCLF
jgi:hypothetical protein